MKKLYFRAPKNAPRKAFPLSFLELFDFIEQNLENRVLQRKSSSRCRIDNAENKSNRILTLRQKFAFSLVEMLLALLVASLLMVAMAPVLTKKFNEQINVVGNGTAGGSIRRVVYLTDPSETEWPVPNGVTNFRVTLVGAGGGGGAGLPWGCEVFTRDSVAQGSIFTQDVNKGCGHTRGASSNFTIPQGITELRATLVSGGAGGAGGGAKWAAEKQWNSAGTYNWTGIPTVLQKDRVLVRMNGAGGGGGGVDQGGAGGGASGGFVNWTIYTIPNGTTSIPIVVGKGGTGGHYHSSPGIGGTGYAAGSNGVSNTSGGGGGGSSSFANGAITAYGGGGGAGSGVNSTATGWYTYSLWKTAFNYGGSGRNGGTRGPANYNGTVYGGASGGTGGSGGGSAYGGAGGNGSVGDTGIALGTSRGGAGGTGGVTGTGAGGYGQDLDCYNTAGTSQGAGGAGGGGGGSFFSAGGSAYTGCYASGSVGVAVTYSQAGTGAGGAGGSCGWNKGAMTGQQGGNGIVIVKYLTHAYGGAGGQAGPAVPPSQIALTSSMKSGSNITIAIGTGGNGGDRVIAQPNGNNTEIRTMNSSGTVNSTTATTNAFGKPGTASTIKFSTTTLATTGTPSCGGGYSGSANTGYSTTGGTCVGSCGTRNKNGACITNSYGYHGNQSAACASANNPRGDYTGTVDYGGNGAVLSFYGNSGCGGAGGIATSKDGGNGSIGGGGGGGYYGGYGGKGGDGYVRLEWGSSTENYSGGGGSAGEVITKNITVSPITRKIKYQIGTGGNGGSYDVNNIKMLDGSNGNPTKFGIGESFGFTSKGGIGGKSAKLTSAYDTNFILSSLTGSHGAGGVAQCTTATDCVETMNGKAGTNGAGGAGGRVTANTKVGNGGLGGTSSSVNGQTAANFDGMQGGGGGGGGGAGAKNGFGTGGKGANGYIIIEYTERFN